MKFLARELSPVSCHFIPVSIVVRAVSRNILAFWNVTPSSWVVGTDVSEEPL
jgi:hypothetical protein